MDSPGSYTVKIAAINDGNEDLVYAPNASLSLSGGETVLYQSRHPFTLSFGDPGAETPFLGQSSPIQSRGSGNDWSAGPFTVDSSNISEPVTFGFSISMKVNGKTIVLDPQVIVDPDQSNFPAVGLMSAAIGAVVGAGIALMVVNMKR